MAIDVWQAWTAAGRAPLVSGGVLDQPAWLSEVLRIFDSEYDVIALHNQQQAKGSQS
jgi:hypothetical protein